MQIFLTFLKVFLVGGALCLIGQILIDKTSLTPAKILTAYVVAGVILGALGLYKPLIEWAAEGAAMPLTGFGYILSQGVKKAIDEHGALGILTGGLTAASGGVAAAVFFGLIFSLFSRPSDKS